MAAGTRRLTPGARIGRMTSSANVANLLTQGSRAMLSASECYRRADALTMTGERDRERMDGRSSAILGARFMFEALEEEGLDLHVLVDNFHRAQRE